ncbi:MAG: hypothetical protein MZW92_41565 [Comamonadaceae bacterium]|nr:hypothetical protein [Comamonadaceae bacterium]
MESPNFLDLFQGINTLVKVLHRPQNRLRPGVPDRAGNPAALSGTQGRAGSAADDPDGLGHGDGQRRRDVLLRLRSGDRHGHAVGRPAGPAPVVAPMAQTPTRW